MNERVQQKMERLTLQVVDEAGALPSLWVVVLRGSSPSARWEGGKAWTAGAPSVRVSACPVAPDSQLMVSWRRLDPN